MGKCVPKSRGSKRKFKAKGLTRRVAVDGKRHKRLWCVLLKKGKAVHSIRKRLPLLQGEVATRRFWSNGLRGVRRAYPRHYNRFTLQ